MERYGIWRRVRIRTLEDSLYLMDAIIKTRGFYRIKIWRWSAWEESERIQGRFVKMTLEINISTPSYILETEVESGLKLIA